MTLFTKIITGRIPSFKIAEDDNYYAFLDINPMKEGHTLVIPKKETDYIFDLSADELAGLMVFAQKVAKAIAKAIPCKRVAVLVLGMQVPHAHVHLIPITNESEIFEHSKLKFLAIEYEATAAKIRQELE